MAQMQAMWTGILSAAFERQTSSASEAATLSKTYAAKLTDAFVDVDDVAALTAHEFGELGIPIGHRKVVRSAASAAIKQRDAAKRSMRLQSRADSATTTSGVLSPPQALQEGAKLVSDNSEPYQSPSFSQGTLPSESLVDTNLSIVVRKSSFHSITWVDISGSCASFDKFIRAIEDVMRSVGLHGNGCEFLMTGFQDNKPMPFATFDVSAPAQLSVLRLPDLHETNGTRLAEITNRIVVWWPTMDPTVVLTYHRCDVDPLKPISDEWDSTRFSALTQPGFYSNVLRCVVRAYRYGLKALQTRSDALEDSAASNVVGMISGMTSIQKQVSVYLRCLTATRDLFDEIATSAASTVDEEDGDAQQADGSDALAELVSATANYRIGVESLISLASELNENANSSINMQMALDGFRASVNMKIFTYMSVILQPISVATGWYGMNFSNMPDLLYEDSYFVFIGIVCGIVVLLMMWLVYRSCIASL
eukprot:CAMPEP_0176428336 /NCGR_PEP_ID=MMETSP0127-20121128/13090_1 /TAXON_ID=938130 /ORGANISM="Platyophrya macrostoma, Strain WH" /LENGTH=478 /DNA_ID=CAMNT_0017810001 /DNA_START=75 /DNA_END=1511 /DNA_ORIENTATION=+